MDFDVGLIGDVFLGFEKHFCLSNVVQVINTTWRLTAGWSGSSGKFGAGWSRRSSGIKGDPTYIYRCQTKHEIKNKDDVVNPKSLILSLSIHEPH